MTSGDVERLSTALKEVPVAALVTDLQDQRFLAVNDRAAELFGVPPEGLVGTRVGDTVVEDDRPAVEKAYSAIATGAVDGYQTRRRIQRPDGSECPVAISGRRFEAPGGPYGLWMLTPDRELSFGDLLPEPPDVVLALTDHDWQLEYVNLDAKLLGRSGAELRGTPLLGYVHPSVATEFLEAASRAVANRMAVTLRTRLRVGRDAWAERHVLLVPMCDHNPPRLGVVVTAAPLGQESAPDQVLQPHVQRSAVEARATRALRALPRLAGLEAAAELSARQVEVVARLIDGEHVDQIARGLYLSPSTVRNHLTAIYRKFGVHSQAELLAALLRAGSPD
jgi:PAS domain S-box-containing protein